MIKFCQISIQHIFRMNQLRNIVLILAFTHFSHTLSYFGHFLAYFNKLGVFTPSHCLTHFSHTWNYFDQFWSPFFLTCLQTCSCIANTRLQLLAVYLLYCLNFYRSKDNVYPIFNLIGEYIFLQAEVVGFYQIIYLRNVDVFFYFLFHIII